MNWKQRYEESEYIVGSNFIPKFKIGNMVELTKDQISIWPGMVGSVKLKNGYSSKITSITNTEIKSYMGEPKDTAYWKRFIIYFLDSIPQGIFQNNLKLKNEH